MWIPIAAGIETEYGILIRGKEKDDPFLASRLLLDAYHEQGVGGPHTGYCMSFPVQPIYVENNTSLVEVINDDSGDPDHSDYTDHTDHKENSDGYAQVQAQSSKEPRIPGRKKIRYRADDMLLANGARFYIDHAHPEYSTPECLSPRLLVAADKAGEHVLARCLYWVNAHQQLDPGEQLIVYKNNSDWKSNSYGCHENYLLSRGLYEDLLYYKSHQIYRYVLPFLITRTILCGSGKVGSENGTAPIGFQLSQRADFFETLIGLQTTYRRPLFNTRDEPHASPDYFRRLHVILGDANMAEYSTYLKIGTAQLVLQMLEEEYFRLDLTLHDPLRAFSTVSRDLSFTHPLLLENGRNMTALDIQYEYLEQARIYLEQGDNNEEQWKVWNAWEQALRLLPNEWKKLATRLDWAIKKYLLDRYLGSQGATWEEVMLWQPVIETLDRQGEEAAQGLAKQMQLLWSDLDQHRHIYFGLRRISLEYHDIRQDAAQGEIGLFYSLQQCGAIERVLTDDAIIPLISQPPRDTRSWLRGKCIEKFAADLVSGDWERLHFSPPQGYILDLSNPYGGTEKDLGAAWSNIHSPVHLLEYLRQPLTSSTFEGERQNG